MTYEENERIERVEKTLVELMSIQKAILADLCGILKELNAPVIKKVTALSNSHVALLRFIASSPLVPDERVKRDLLDQISRFETAAERDEALEAWLEQLLKNFPASAGSSDSSFPGTGGS